MATGRERSRRSQEQVWIGRAEPLTAGVRCTFELPKAFVRRVSPEPPFVYESEWMDSVLKCLLLRLTSSYYSVICLESCWVDAAIWAWYGSW